MLQHADAQDDPRALLAKHEELLQFLCEGHVSSSPARRPRTAARPPLGAP